MDPHPKPKTPKDPVYLDRIRAEPCLICGQRAIPHHMRGIDSTGKMSGKVSDFYTIPICPECHNEAGNDQRFLYMIEGIHEDLVEKPGGHLGADYWVTCDRWVLIWIIKSLEKYILELQEA